MADTLDYLKYSTIALGVGALCVGADYVLEHYQVVAQFIDAGFSQTLRETLTDTLRTTGTVGVVGGTIATPILAAKYGLEKLLS